jgi:hypothetical protein
MIEQFQINDEHIFIIHMEKLCVRFLVSNIQKGTMRGHRWITMYTVRLVLNLGPVCAIHLNTVHHIPVSRDCDAKCVTFYRVLTKSTALFFLSINDSFEQPPLTSRNDCVYWKQV